MGMNLAYLPTSLHVRFVPAGLKKRTKMLLLKLTKPRDNRIIYEKLGCDGKPKQVVIKFVDNRRCMMFIQRQ